MKRRREGGFTLIEIAIALVILGLLLTGLLGPLSTRVEQAERQKTSELMDELKDALLGYAATYGFLPCPSTQPDPTNANYGLADVSCPGAATADGYLPWRTLGISATDAWGGLRIQATDPWVGYWRYRVDRNFVGPTLITLTTPFSVDALSVLDPIGTPLTGTPPAPPAELPVAIVFSAGGNRVPDGENADYEATNGVYQGGGYSATFDDITIWIGRPLLFNRMIAAGRLP